MTRLKIFTGNANPDLAAEICAYLCIPIGSAVIKRFSDGEVNVEIRDNVRGVDVFVIQPTSPPVNDHLMELLILMDGLKRASAKRVTAVLPYYGYARQDRKVLPRAPITAKLVADLITAAGVCPGADDGPPRGADPGFLQHPGGPPLFGAGDARVHQDRITERRP